MLRDFGAVFVRCRDLETKRRRKRLGSSAKNLLEQSSVFSVQDAEVNTMLIRYELHEDYLSNGRKAFFDTLKDCIKNRTPLIRKEHRTRSIAA